MLEIGKLPPQMLERLILNPISAGKIKRPEVIIRPKTGEDCAALYMEEEYCVASTDPITGAQKEIGYLAVHINCNDIAASGATPIGIMLTLLLPKESTEEVIQEIMAGVQEATNELGIEILGGHTEITDAVNKPILSATAIGKTYKRNFISTGGAQIGQDIIMTKWAGLEGTAIISKDFERELKGRIPEEMLCKAQDMKGFLSILPEARLAVEHGATALHDATEGGILGAVWEVADCSDTGIEVFLDKIPIKDETKTICKEAGISPYSLISSGTLVISTFDGEDLVRKLKAEGIEAAIIGRITDGGKYFWENGKKQVLAQPVSDAIYQVDFKKE
jgi:hydrogenase expression/formation protein HypE